MKRGVLKGCLALSLVLPTIQNSSGAGVELVVAMEPGQGAASNELVRLEDNTLRVLQRRIDAAGYHGTVKQVGQEGILTIQVCGFPEERQPAIQRFLLQPGLLEFRMVHPSNTIYLAEDIVPPSCEILRERRTQPDGREILIPYLVRKEAERGLTSKYIERAMVTRSALTADPEIQFELDPEGSRLFAEITREYQPAWTGQGTVYHQLAIVLDGTLYSAPRIQEPIEGGRGMISGSFSLHEAMELASILENGLPLTLRLISRRPMDPATERQLIDRDRTIATVRNLLVTLFILALLLGAVCALILWRRRRGRTSLGPPPLPSAQ